MGGVLMRGLLMGIVALALVAGCTNRNDRLAFDGQFFRSKASKVDGDRREIEVTVKPVSASPKGALEAGRYEATRYCVLTFGNSKIDWAVGPDQDPETLQPANDTLVLRGTCEG